MQPSLCHARPWFPVLLLVALAGIGGTAWAAEAGNVTQAVKAFRAEENELLTKLPLMIADEDKIDKKTRTLAKEDGDIKRDSAKNQKSWTKWRMDFNKAKVYQQSILKSGCRPGQRTSAAEARRCNPMIQKSNRDYEDLASRKKTLDTTDAGLANRRSKLTTDTLQNTAELKRVRAEIATTRQRIAAIKGRMDAIQSVCPAISENISDEELKHRCGNIQFDQAAPGLPPCDTEACRKYDCLVFSRCK